MKRNAIIAMMAGFALVFSGCSGDAGGSGETINGIPESAVGSDWDNVSYAELLKMRDKSILDRQEYYYSIPDATDMIRSFPDVPLIRFIQLSEYSTVMVDCLSQKGYNVRQDGTGISFLDTEEVLNTKSNILDLYICEAQYTIDPRTYDAVYPRVRAELLYMYRQGVYTECVKELGYHVSDPPSLESWLDQYYRDGSAWDPASQVRVVIGTNEALQIELDHSCPEFPEDFWPVIPSE